MLAAADRRTKETLNLHARIADLEREVAQLKASRRKSVDVNTGNFERAEQVAEALLSRIEALEKRAARDVATVERAIPTEAF
jgi:hypothetical protein